MGGYAYAARGEPCANREIPFEWDTAFTFSGPTTSPWPSGWPVEMGFLFGGKDVGSSQDCDGYTLDDTWTAKTNTPIYLWGAGSSNIDNKIYVAYGKIAASSFLVRTDEFSLNTWSSKTAAPSPARTFLASSHIENNKMYCSGGSIDIPVSDNDSYDTDTWTSKTDMVSPFRYYFNSATADNKIYCVGGFTGTNTLADCDQYVDDTWSTRATLGTSTYSNSIFSVGLCLYMAYGDDVSDHVTTCLGYSPDFWTTKTSGGSPSRYRVASIELGHAGLVLCGNAVSDISDNDEYDPDTWTARAAAPLPARTFASGGYITG